MLPSRCSSPSGEITMPTGQFVFSQVMDHLPMKAFRRYVQRYHGNRYVKSFTCLDQFLCLAFAQLTHRESLRDIEVCLRAPGQTLPLRPARQGRPYYPGPCQPNPRRAPVCRLRPRPHPHRPTAVCRGRPGPGPRLHRLCPGLLHHRPVPDRLPLTRISHQGDIDL